MTRRPLPFLIALAASPLVGADAPPPPAEAPMAAAAAPAPAAPLPWTGTIGGFVGGKAMDHDDWHPVDGQGAFGIIFDARPRSWPISFCVHLIGSAGYDKDDDTDIETRGTTSELQLGVKKIFGDDGPGIFRAWVGGGLDIVTAWLEIDPPRADERRDHDSGVGGWVGGGVHWIIARHFVIGPIVEASFADEVRVFDRERQAGGLLLGVLAGYHW